MADTSLSRWESLDYLRGLMALSILIFHYEKWTTGVWNPATPQGKLGVYAVSIFFIISGMALAYTYTGSFRERTDAWKGFARKRFFRIYPLLWLATLATLVLDHFQRTPLSVALNLSGLFGLVNPAGDIATGAWSIGCELVYYLAFPFLLRAGIRDRRLLLLIAALLFVAGMVRGFFFPFASEEQEQAVWWNDYVQAWLHAWYFVAGMALVFYRDMLSGISARKQLFLAITGAAVFLAVPVSGNPQALVGGSTKIVLSVSALVLAGGWAFGIRRFSGWQHRVLAWLGAVSYSLYLLHPLVFRAVKSLLVHSGFDGPALVIPVLATPVALLLSHFSYYYFERQMLRDRWGVQA